MTTASNAQVTLRAIEIDDAPVIHGWYSEEAFRSISGARYPSSSERWREWAAKRKEPEFGNAVFGICLTGEQQLIGMGSLRNPSIEDRSAELSLLLGSAEHRGRGIGLLAGSSVLQFGFGVMGLHRIYMKILAHNAAALAGAKALGGVLEGTAREERFINGKFCDVQLFGVLAAEFKPRP